MVVGIVDRPVHADVDPPRPRRSWRLVRRPAADRPDPDTRRRRELDGVRSLLEDARGLLADGWVQDAFYLVRGRHGEPRPVSPFGLLLLSRTDVVGACLVGSVAHASAGIDRQVRTGRSATAVDMLYEALVEPESELGSGHPAVRAARVRELARWNDEPGRTREDVLGLVDRAVDRTITAAVR